MQAVSAGELHFIEQGVAQDVRNDGRSRLDYRQFNIQPSVIPQANGSARIQLDETDVIVGVNVEIDEPPADAPQHGKIVCSVDCSAAASPDFAGYGARALNVELTRVLEAVVRDSHTLDTESLCIIPGKQCWALYVDALVLGCGGGNLHDACAMAAVVALNTALVPRVQVVQGEDEGDLDIEVSDDPYDMDPLAVADVPLCVSLVKIGQRFVADATLEEEACMDARVSVAVNRKGQLCGTVKTGPGRIAPSSLVEMMQCAKRIGVELFEQVDKCAGE